MIMMTQLLQLFELELADPTHFAKKSGHRDVCRPPSALPHIFRQASTQRQRLARESREGKQQESQAPLIAVEKSYVVEAQGL
jgi:hypothetical protein